MPWRELVAETNAQPRTLEFCINCRYPFLIKMENKLQNYIQLPEKILDHLKVIHL